MSLLEKIGQLRLKAVAADDEDKIRSRCGEFTALRERFQSATANAASVAVARDELRAAGISQDGYDQDRSSALGLVKDLIDTIENLSVEAKFDLVKIQGNTIEAYFKNSEKSIADAWKTFMPASAPADDGLLNALEQAGIDVEAIRSDIESARSVLFTLRNRVLPQPGDIAKLRKALDTLNSTGERIGKLIDPAIADVVVRAQGNGVPYSDITPEVIVALRKLGILNRFVVVLI